VSVSELLAAAGRVAGTGGRMLVLTSCDLRIPECETLIGFADRRRQVAVVSTARLNERDVPSMERTARRVGNAIAHEAGHLDGLAHCGVPGCLMHPITTAEEIDARADGACGRCPHTGMARRRILAATAFLGIVGTGVLSLDRVGTALFGSDLVIPFTCRAVDAAGRHTEAGSGAGDRAVFHFEGEPLFAMYDKDGHASILDRSRPIMHRLNDLWRSERPLVLGASSGDGAIVANGVALTTVLPGDARGRPRSQVADEWATRIAEVFREHGRMASIDRRVP
jgi:hypothetical protein